MLSILLSIGLWQCPAANAGEVVDFAAKRAAPDCTPSLLGFNELDVREWFHEIVDAEGLSNATFEAMGSVNGGTYGLLSTYSHDRELQMFGVLLDRSERLIVHDRLFDGSGTFGSDQLALARVSARQAIRNMLTATFARQIDGARGSIVHSVKNVAPREAPVRDFALSASGEYLATYDRKAERVQVRALERPSRIRRFGLEGDPEMVWLHGVSDDGRYVALSIRERLSLTRVTILDLNTGEIPFSAALDASGFPAVRFSAAGWTILNEDEVGVFQRGRRTATFPLRAATIKGILGMTQVNRPGGAFTTSAGDELLIFSHGPQPVKYAGRSFSIFEDARAAGAQAKVEGSIDNLDRYMAADKYEGIADTHFAASADLRIAVQVRSSGSAMNLSLHSSAVVFGADGKVRGSVTPFWSIGAVALSADGSLLAVSEQYGGPMEFFNERKRIWIYATDNLEVPVVAIDDVPALTIDQLRFSADRRKLFVESINSRTIFKFRLPLPASLH